MVVVVVGIVATIAYPFYTTAKERALDKEAIANLKLIQAAQ
ncbi:MAG: prepilin-type cleavage/methylation domain-containing protein, partial [Candidatus Omnitrophica bacterium]|nr:prepilin-type cleavage/methylation domain-containing protein [Candidatus Omnitrophota bacterium]